jgi:hypothetical protein
MSANSNSQRDHFDTSISLPYARKPFTGTACEAISTAVQILNREIRLERAPLIHRISGSLGRTPGAAKFDPIDTENTLLALPFVVESSEHLQAVAAHLRAELTTYFEAEYQLYWEVVEPGNICHIRIACDGPQA